jgi:endonuclease YncB( thermonuclease family)
MHLGKAERIGLYGIDYPERGQDFSTRARKFTSRMVFGKMVDVEPVDRDRYGRPVAWVAVNGERLHRELLRAGLAWWYRKYAPDDDEVPRLESEGRAARRGLWSMPNPVPHFSTAVRRYFRPPYTH